MERKPAKFVYLLKEDFQNSMYVSSLCLVFCDTSVLSVMLQSHVSKGNQMTLLFGF